MIEEEAMCCGLEDMHWPFWPGCDTSGCDISHSMDEGTDCEGLLL